MEGAVNASLAELYELTAAMSQQLIAQQEIMERLQKDLAVAHSFVENADLFWMFWGAVMVFFMQCGFALLEAGSVRTKSTANILLKNLVDACLSGVLWYLVGYPLSDNTGNAFIGTEWSALTSDNVDWGRWMFSWAFAATAATIVSGAVAERCSFVAYVVYTIVLTSFVYPTVAHWGWAERGWLAELKFHDFAGGCIVHVLGGAAAFVAAVSLGPRLKRFSKDENGKNVTHAIPGHSTTLAVLGVFILWFAWYGFNPVSTLSFADMKVATRVGVTTTISACTGGITVLLISMLYGNPPMVSSVVNGILSGLVGITAPCAVVKPYLALVIGAVSGVLYYHASAFLKRFAIDDPLDASPLHYVCGMWGTVAVGLFASKEYMAHVRGVDVSETTPYAGLLMGGNGMQLGVQLAGCASVTAWAVFFCTVMFSCLNACNMFRVPAMDEILGLDIAQHGGKAYNDAFRSESYSQEAAELHWERQEIAELGISKASDAKLDNPNKWTSQDSLTGMNLLPGTIP